MRLTTKNAAIDQQKAERELLFALEQGVNYLDCAYIYPGIETAVGKFLSKGYRDSVHLATKLPHYLIKKPIDLDRYFEEQLRRLQTNRIDYYLLHMLGDIGAWERMLNYGIIEWVLNKKASGQINNFGFSFHGGCESFLQLIDAFDWDFCMIQYNYIDDYSQAGIRGLKYAADKGIPVIIMEPLRGGRLADKLPKEAKALFDGFSPKRSPAEWAFRWLYAQKEVSVVLSGMNSIAQIEENTRIASEDRPAGLTCAELELFVKVREAIRKNIKVPCTGCGYCMPCPQGVDIPVCFNCLNALYSEGFYTGMKEYFMCTALGVNQSTASGCIRCGKCERHCPQGIEIRRELALTAKKLENIAFHAARKIVKLRGFYR
ncbi:MAG: aldo/keto reductase [Clostridiales bacterium]|nr:aldo/keto reductase [Clostridiales bacterium]